MLQTLIFKFKTLNIRRQHQDTNRQQQNGSPSFSISHTQSPQQTLSISLHFWFLVSSSIINGGSIFFSQTRFLVVILSTIFSDFQFKNLALTHSSSSLSSSLRLPSPMAWRNRWSNNPVGPQRSSWVPGYGCFYLLRTAYANFFLELCGSIGSKPLHFLPLL